MLTALYMLTFGMLYAYNLEASAQKKKDMKTNLGITFLIMGIFIALNLLAKGY